MSDKATKALEDFHTITPHLTVRGVSEAVKFYEKAFGAAELYRNLAPDGKSVMHVELMLGDSRFFLHDEFPEHGELSPLGGQATGVVLHLYVEDVDDFTSGRSTPGRRSSCRCRTVSGEIATPSSSIRSAIAGRWRRESKTFRPGSSRSGPASSMPSIPSGPMRAPRIEPKAHLFFTLL